ncbi:MAG: hypothetical protein A2V75_09875 [Actinobacteria bacterium RBG_16_70_17]|nr:MAG: hypothetical protein A2V75_09875 [Actinobacteria bacterium RBG_16_70_17]
MRRLILPLLVVGVLVIGCGGDEPSLGGARTYYESLDLASPREAVATFADAFQRNDFMTVWLVLDADAQLHLQQDLNMAQWGQFFDTAASPEYRTALETEVFPFQSWDSHDSWEFFDRLMLMADGHDAFLIDLSGQVNVTGESPSAGWGYTDLTAEVEGIEGDVIFRMAQAPSGKWRVHQVIAPGGDEQSVPWSVPAPNG